MLGLAVFVARTSSGEASDVLPLTSRPEPSLTSATLSVALPAVLVTSAGTVVS